MKTASMTLHLVAYIGSEFLPSQFSMSAVFIIPVFLMIISLAGDDLKNRNTPLNSKLSVWSGEISCSFNLVHFLVLFYFLNLTTGNKFDLFQGVTLIAVALILSVSCPDFLYKYFEVPVMKWILSKCRMKKLVILPETV